ncbi:MAG: Hsp70 family protein [Planctomycetes bacterium]|nr:Hsp70 family protein [Planctomycetota bacterium]
MTIIAIDLGTTNSLVAVMRDGQPVTLPNELGDHLTPSAVAMAEDGGLLVGRPAWDRLVAAPQVGRAFFKRDMGTTKTYGFGGRRWSPIECSALVLGEMRRVAQLHLGGEVRDAVITVPAYFREGQRQATVEAANLAGLAVTRIVNEPTAAALAYGLVDPGQEKRLLVLDLGGGTFDVTLLELWSGVVEVRATGGESHLGGEDYTDALLDMLLGRCGLDRSLPNLGRIRARLESLKRRLSVHERGGIVLEGFELLVSRDDFARATAELTGRMRPIVARCLRDAGLQAGEVDAVLLVGGATRMHMIRDFVRGEFGRDGLADHDPDRVVALGAAVQAALCAGDAAVQDLVLTDVSSHTLGIETSMELAPGHIVSGYFAPIIDRNTTVPVSRAQRFNALSSSQDEITVMVFQGEARLTKDNHLLGKLQVTGLRRPHPEVGIIDVRFSYDMSGLLEVDVVVVHSGARFHTVIEERPGALQQHQIEEIRARLAPLKIAARERLPNRARLERANRVYAMLTGQDRDALAEVLRQFEVALETGLEESWQEAGRVLDAFLAQFPLEEGDWQPPPDGADSQS